MVVNTVKTIGRGCNMVASFRGELGEQCDQIKLPNVCKSCPKMISLEK